jgi:hypothetical protein
MIDGDVEARNPEAFGWEQKEQLREDQTSSHGSDEGPAQLALCIFMRAHLEDAAAEVTAEPNIHERD